jgi:hypothetical protein
MKTKRSSQAARAGRQEGNRRTPPGSTFLNSSTSSLVTIFGIAGLNVHGIDINTVMLPLASDTFALRGFPIGARISSIFPATLLCVNHVYMNRAVNWMNQAERDLQHARNAKKDGDYEWACFAVQQAAEKARC